MKDNLDLITAVCCNAGAGNGLLGSTEAVVSSMGNVWYNPILALRLELPRLTPDNAADAEEVIREFWAKMAPFREE